MTVVLLVIILLCVAGTWLAVADIRNDVRALRRATEHGAPPRAKWR